MEKPIYSSIHKYESKNGYKGYKYRVAYSYISPETGKTVRTCKRGFKYEKDARAWATNELPNVIKQLEKEAISDEEMTMDVLIEEYLEHIKLWNRDTTVEIKENTIRTKIMPYFKGKKVYAIGNNDIRQWQNWVKQGKTRQGTAYAETYLRTISNHLSAIFEHAVEYHNLPNNPIKNVKRMGKKTAPEAAFWRFDEYQKFIKSIQDEPIGYYVFQILFYCGFREGEVLALKKENIDFENNTIKVKFTFRRKGGKDVYKETKTPESKRTVTIPQFLADELKEYIDGLYHIDDDTRLFPLLKGNLYTILNKGCARSGVKKIPVHGLRHSSVSFLNRMLKVDMEDISKRVGHTSTKMTELYTHEYGDEGIEVANKLDRFMEVLNNVSEE